MSTADSLTEEQRNTVKSWVEEGTGLSEIQRRLGDEFQVSLTFMDTRFLLDDLQLELQSDEDEEEKRSDSSVGGGDLLGAEPGAPGAPGGPTAPGPADAMPTGPDEGLIGDEAGLPPGEDAGGDGGVTVTISDVQRPGVLVSGRVTFAGGQSAEWALDQMGRLAFDPVDPTFRPSESDMMAFQRELEKQARSRGF